MNAMNKFCVRCGAFLEAPNANQKYCVVCAHNVQLEQQAKWRRRKGKTERVMGLCAWCGKAMVKKTPDQKYHKDCARKAERSCAPAGYQFKLPEKQRPTPPRYSIKQINDKAKSLGMNYGHYSTLLSQGKVEPPDER